MARLFLAVNLPPKLKEKIFNTFSKKLLKDKNIKVVPKENLHITLLFLGEVAENDINSVKEKLSRIKFKKFKIKLSNLGEFGNRVIWIFADAENDSLKTLSQRIQKSLNIYDERFHPHITICRLRKPSKEAKHIVEKFSKLEFEEEFVVDRFSLMQSFLKSPAPEYKEIFSVKLA